MMFGGTRPIQCYVTQAHGLFIDALLVSAGCVINETTITLDEASQLDALEFFHIKLENHDVIYAEGAPVETLLEVDESAVNFAEYFSMHGAPTDREVPCLPILSYWRREAVRSRGVRSAVSGIDRRRQIGVIRHRLARWVDAISRIRAFSLGFGQVWWLSVGPDGVEVMDGLDLHVMGDRE